MGGERPGIPFERIGAGESGGKATGLIFFREMLAAEYDPSRSPRIDVGVPRFAVITTEVFDEFWNDNGLAEVTGTGRTDEEIARAFQQAVLPAALTCQLERLVERVRVPLAVRSSSVLEDAIFHPFAGVYETKMLPNNQPDRALRLRKLEEAIKLVYASTFFRASQGYLRASGRDPGEEKMAVVLQEIVGDVHGERFYPVLSGVARTHNFYPTGGARPEHGVVSLALGLGKTIVDGGICWSYSPTRPKAPPPYGSVGELMRNSQLRFWCVNMGEPPVDDPLAEAEHLLHLEIDVADRDGVLSQVASTYDARSDRAVPGTGIDGPRIVNFAPLLVLRTFPINDVVRDLLAISERAAGAPVELEFAMSLPPDGARPRLGFLQLRPMVVCHETVEIGAEEIDRPELLLHSSQVMGNGSEDSIRDVVFVKPDAFEAAHTRAIAAELEALNSPLHAGRRPYVLIGFGRWGSSDPWLGIPVEWSQICGARVIVEATLPSMNVELSQGSHFFHNLCSFGIPYLSVHHEARPGIDWSWLSDQPAARETRFVRHLRLDEPLLVKVDGRTGKAAIWRR